MLTYSSFLLSKAEDNEELKSDLEVIVRETKRCREIVKGTITVRSVFVDEQVEISVQDTGCGIPPEHLDKIFDPFFTTKGASGTGLGLAIVWGIIEEHGGKINVDSKVDIGTTFRILLPAAVESGVAV